MGSWRLRGTQQACATCGAVGFSADTMVGMHGRPAVMWTQEDQADPVPFHLGEAEECGDVAGMQVRNPADFAAVQSILRVGGLKGVSTHRYAPWSLP